MTRRTTRRGLTKAPLSDFENAVMQVIWTLGPSAVDAVHRVVSQERSVKETTTRTILRRLERKGYLEHEADGRAYVYRAVEPARSLAAQAVRQIIDRFCGGSVEELVSGMVESEVLSKSELKAIEELIRTGGREASARKKGR